MDSQIAHFADIEQFKVYSHLFDIEKFITDSHFADFEQIKIHSTPAKNNLKTLPSKKKIQEFKNHA